MKDVMEVYVAERHYLDADGDADSILLAVTTDLDQAKAAVVADSPDCFGQEFRDWGHVVYVWLHKRGDPGRHVRTLSYREPLDRTLEEVRAGAVGQFDVTWEESPQHG